MQTQVKPKEYISKSPEVVVKYKNSAPASKIKQKYPEFDSQVQRINKLASDFFAKLPNKISGFYQESKFPVISFALLVITVYSLRISQAILSSFNKIPLVRPFFELIGIGYIFFFLYRNLLTESKTKELLSAFGLGKKQNPSETASESST